MLERIAGAIRGHWAIENEFHWCLDMAFDEDGSRARTRNAAKDLRINARESPLIC